MHYQNPKVILVFLVLILMLPNATKCDENMSRFISDLISSYNLISPTIIYHGGAPEICFTSHWVLCLNTEKEQIAPCRTVAGPSFGMKCIFPFTMKETGTTFNACVPDLASGIPWCSTKVDEMGFHIGGEGNWGDCSSECPIAEGKLFIIF